MNLVLYVALFVTLFFPLSSLFPSNQNYDVAVNESAGRSKVEVQISDF